MNNVDVIVIGGGAAGLFCAIEAGKRGRKVLVLEHAERVGKKIAISGGGRCNFTNIHTSPENFLSANPSFCKSALARYTPADFIALVRKHNIGFNEKKLGQLFCNEGSRRIIDMLLDECSDAGVEVACRSTVQSLTKQEYFEITVGDRTFRAQSLVIATGGLSIAPLGATDFGYRIARQFGLEIEETKPGLVPLTLTKQVLQQLAPLSGVSVDAAASCNGKQFRENLLITHRGLSGPAILQISSYWKPGQPIEIDLLPDQDALQLLTQNADSETSLAKLLTQFLPKRFSQAWCELNFPSQPLNRYTPRQLSEIATKLHQWRILPSGTEGYKKAEVTAGGVSTNELSSKTMEARKVAGLYFIGEVVDVTGQLGGYNFQWAWASGYAAGQYV
ncbi:MAG TPA: NAD(P)/FAD-dependent oxidoreductase [Pyrinomonadaceae bacterium]